MRRLVRWLLVLALSLSIGLQWAVVQGAAWVGMIVSQSQEVSIAQSIKRTFDGSHPCRLCLAAQDGVSKSKKQDAERGSIKLVLAAPEIERFAFPSPAVTGDVAIPAVLVSRSSRPPSPPPRGV